MEGNSFDNVEWRQHPWPGLNWLTTAICCDDVKAAIDFYSQALGFVPIFELPHEGRIIFARMRYRGANFTVNSPSFESDLATPRGEKNSLFYLYVDDVAATAARMAELGAELKFAPQKEFWGDTRARLADPFGYVWDIAQAPAASSG